MEKTQQTKYDMFVRVKAFGSAHQDLFPSESVGSEAFAVVARALDEIDSHLTRKVLAAAEARKVQSATRRAVVARMNLIAKAARLLAKRDGRSHPFRMPKRRSASTILSTARAFAEAAAPRAEEFARLGLPPDFLTVFQARIAALEEAVDRRQSSRTDRLSAQEDVERALATGLEAIQGLDVIVANAVGLDPARLATWESVRRLDGSSRPAPHPVPVPVPAPQPVTPSPESVTMAVRQAS